MFCFLEIEIHIKIAASAAALMLCAVFLCVCVLPDAYSLLLLEICIIYMYIYACVCVFFYYNDGGQSLIRDFRIEFFYVCILSNAYTPDHIARLMCKHRLFLIESRRCNVFTHKYINISLVF